MNRCLIALIILVFSVIGLFSQNKNERIFKNLGNNINTSNDEFQPMIYNDTLYFKRSVKSDKSDNSIFFIALKDITCPSRNIKKLKQIQLFQLKTLKAKNLLMFNSTPSFLFYNTSETIDNNLDKSESLLILNSEYNEIHPTISKDGQTIVFASDRFGDHSNTDLYVTLRNKDGSWSAPKKLSTGLNGINTKEYEITPYISADGSLYYSSEGFSINNTEFYFSATEEKSNSQNDLFVAKVKKNFNIVKAEPDPSKKGNWINPKVLDFPFNTKWDDIGPTLYLDKESGESLIFLSSNRNYHKQWGDGYGSYDLYGYCLEKCIDCNDSCDFHVIDGFIDIQCANINDYSGRMKVYSKEKDSLKLIDEFFVENKNNFSWLAPYPYDRNFIFEYYHPCLDDNIIRTVTIPCLKQNKFNCPDCIEQSNDIKKVRIDTFSVAHPCCCKPIELEVQLNCYNRKKKGLAYQITDGDNKIVAKGNVDKKGKILAKLEFSNKFNINVFYKCNGMDNFNTEIFPECSKNSIKKYFGQINFPLECCCKTDLNIEENFEIPFFVTGYYYPTTRENFNNLQKKMDMKFKNNDNVKYIDIKDYNYQETFSEIENYLAEITQFIISKINEDECFCSKLEVKVTGFADQREIYGGENALFDDRFDFDNDIKIGNDVKQNIFSTKPQMTNNLLSIIRAFNTAKYIKSMVQNYISEETTQVNWIVEGKGIDNTTNLLERKRKIRIEIKCIE